MQSLLVSVYRFLNHRIYLPFFQRKYIFSLCEKSITYHVTLISTITSVKQVVYSVDLCFVWGDSWGNTVTVVAFHFSW